MPVLLMGFAPESVDATMLNQVRTLAPELRVVVTRDRGDIEALLPRIEIIVGNLPPDLVLQAPRLRWFQQWRAGADWLLRYPEAADRGFVLTNTSGVQAVPISEQIIGTLLMFGRGLHHAVQAQSRQEWWRPAPADLFELEGKTMLLLGVGAIGQRTVHIASALGMRVEGIRRDSLRAVDGAAAMYRVDQLLDRLANADVVVVTVPLSHATRRMIGTLELRTMKPAAYLINIGRGGTIDEAALVTALREGWIAGAALDVFAEEPLPASSPLWTMGNVIITAHYGGLTPRYEERAWAIFLDNLSRYVAQAPLRNVVDKHAGY